jgi:hypothetical protein
VIDMPTRYANELTAAAAPLCAALDPDLAGLVIDIICVAELTDLDDRLQAIADLADAVRKLMDATADEAMAEYDRRNNGVYYEC